MIDAEEHMVIMKDKPKQNYRAGGIIIYVFDTMRVAVLCNDRGITCHGPAIVCTLLVATGMPDRLHATQIIVKSKCETV
jgi:hypothetical protein